MYITNLGTNPFRRPYGGGRKEEEEGWVVAPPVVPPPPVAGVFAATVLGAGRDDKKDILFRYLS